MLHYWEWIHVSLSLSLKKKKHISTSQQKCKLKLFSFFFYLYPTAAQGGSSTKEKAECCSLNRALRQRSFTRCVHFHWAARDERNTHLYWSPQSRQVLCVLLVCVCVCVCLCAATFSRVGIRLKWRLLQCVCVCVETTVVLRGLLQHQSRVPARHTFLSCTPPCSSSSSSSSSSLLPFHTCLMSFIHPLFFSWLNPSSRPPPHTTISVPLAVNLCYDCSRNSFFFFLSLSLSAGSSRYICQSVCSLVSCLKMYRLERNNFRGPQYHCRVTAENAELKKKKKKKNLAIGGRTEHKHREILVCELPGPRWFGCSHRMLRNT